MTDATCHLCAGEAEGVLDLGEQPLTNRFLESRENHEARFPLSLAVCRRCALVQVPRPAPADELRPRFDWIGYREPDAHLDHVAAVLTDLPGLSAGSRVLGIGDHDEPLLERLRERGFAQAEALAWRRALGADEPNAHTETLQAKLTPERARELEPADVVLARSLVEHAHDLNGLLAALRELVTPGGHLLVEVPDCAPAFERADYSAIWEEHILYFTPATLERALASAGFARAATPAAPADHLVMIARAASEPQAPAGADGAELRQARGYGTELPRVRERWRSYLAGERADGRRVAMLGAGHAGFMFVNALGLGELIECVIDDHPKKQGLLAPGSRLPVLPSSALAEREIDVCLLAVSRETEERVEAAQDDWVQAGGRFRSIFPASPRHPLEAASCA